MRKVTVTYSIRECGSVPMIRLRGKWLGLAGFQEGKCVQVTVAAGKLTLTLDTDTARMIDIGHHVG